MILHQRALVTHLRSALLHGAVVSMFGLAVPVFADQAADAQAASATQTKKDSTATQLGNVTVTAQSRTQEVQAVPIAIQVVTQEQIDKLQATDISKLNGYIPGIVVDASQATQPYYSMRGISVSDFGIGTDSPIGVYEDGVYTGKTGGALLIFDDVQRVEVLKGPQGTLFGRNSAGGAISVVTNAPEDAWEEQARIRLGNYGTRYVDAMINAPLTSDLALRVSAVDNQSHGWLRDAATGQHYNKNDDWGVRTQLRWNGPADTSVRFAWEHEELNQPARAAIGVVPLPAAPGYPPFPADPQNWLNPLTAPVYNDVIGDKEARTFDAATMMIEHPFSFGTFTSITAYRHISTINREENDGTNRIYLYFDDANIEQNNNWSQEFRLAGKTDLADWVGGLSYYYDNARQESQLNFFTDSIDTLIRNLSPTPVTPDGTLYGFLTNNVLAPNGLPGLLGDPWRESMFNHGIAQAWAVYGDVIWHLNDRLNLTTGVRFTRDSREFSWYNPLRTADALDATLAALQAGGFFDFPGVPPIEALQYPLYQPGQNGNIEFNTLAATAAPLTVNRSWSDTSPRVLLDYKLTPNTMVYGSVTKGYQAGGFNALLPASQYEPETVWNYEGGVKSYLPDQRVMLDASIYHYRFTNLQSLSLVANGNGNLPQYLVTISDQQATGIDAEVHWLATDALRLNAALAYIDATYDHYVTSDGKDLSGQSTGEPLVSFAVGMDYVWHDVAGGDLDFTLQHAYRGKTRCNADATTQGTCQVTPAFQLGVAQNRTDLRLAWSSNNTPWSLALYVNNVFDKRYVTGLNNITATVLGTPFANISPPRMWGVEAAVHF
ncbi:MAG: TonB-dependent receptor [Proteobacteria bacterium]|nr:TonB-dependent receptor [Pseudomonadota bacterium]